MSPNMNAFVGGTGKRYGGGVMPGAGPPLPYPSLLPPGGGPIGAPGQMARLLAGLTGAGGLRTAASVAPPTPSGVTGTGQYPARPAPPPPPSALLFPDVSGQTQGQGQRYTSGVGSDADQWPGVRATYGQRQGYANLLDILQSQGRTDPRLFNNLLNAIMRSTANNQSGLEEWMASQGLSGSGVAEGLLAAEGQAGTNAISQAYANEAATQEARKRQDLQLLLDLIVNPRLQRRGQDLGIGAQQTAENAARRGANASNIAAIVGLISRLV